MFNIRKALVTDLNNLLILITNINETEREYLRYDKESDTLLPRLLKNIKEDHVILFVNDDLVFGFLEYTIQANSKIWIYSFYVDKTYRRKTYNLLMATFVAMKKCYKLPIRFTVQKGNRTMEVLARYIKAEFVEDYGDGRCEYLVKVVET